jgi:hypothetical protein
MPEYSNDKRKIFLHGIEMDLVRESRWSRKYHSKDKNQGYGESKFMDGTASITLPELQAEWKKWDRIERLDFAYNIAWADKDILPDILRFIMSNGSFEDWSGCALSISSHLPKEESIPFLTKACKECPAGKSSNLLQALAHTKAPGVLVALRECLEQLWSNDALYVGEGWNNWIAFDAACCMQYMLELGEPAEALREKYEVLKKHANEHLRSTAMGYLSKYFQELA